MLLYFQVCSNSANPQHSGERYRTSGPLVLKSMDQQFKKSQNIKNEPPHEQTCDKFQKGIREIFLSFHGGLSKMYRIYRKILNSDGGDF